MPGPRVVGVIVARCWIIAVFSIVASACQITPPPSPIKPSDACAIPKHVIVTRQPDEDAGGSLGEESPFNLRLRGLLAQPSQPSGFVEPKTPEILFLSGGSQKGAFGAGFLKGWSQRPGGLPQFDLVTGVSAGAILSTAAFIGDGDGAAERFSSIDKESDVLKAFAKRNSRGDFTMPSYVRIARNGAAADLAPMRATLVAYLKSGRSDGQRVIEAARARADTNDLFVGAVDLDSGQFVAFDLSQYLRDQPRAQPVSDRAIDCYASAILASSSVPLAALPVFIDGRIYVDGGARNGMFGWQLVNELTQLSLSQGNEPPPPAPNLYLVVNGTQEIDPDCGAYRKQKIAPQGPSQQQDEFCRKVVGDPQALPSRRPTWSIADVGMRSVDVLVNQVYRANAQSIFQAYQLAYRTTDGFHFARMKPDAPDFAHDGRTCGSGSGYVSSDGVETWYDLNERTTRPLEFYPDYMKCLIAYGEHIAKEAGW